MKTSLIKTSMFLILGAILYMTGCSEGPTGFNSEPTSLGEAILKTMRPKDGHWTGKTDQDDDISFDVINQGTVIDSGFVITISFDEWWGYGYLTYTRTISTSIEDKEFTIDSNGSFCSLNVEGNFENSTNCSGTYNLSGDTGYPYYLSFSAEGTWTANWAGSGVGSLSKKSAAHRGTDGKESPTIFKNFAQERVELFLNLSK